MSFDHEEFYKAKKALAERYGAGGGLGVFYEAIATDGKPQNRGMVERTKVFNANILIAAVLLIAVGFGIYTINHSRRGREEQDVAIEKSLDAFIASMEAIEGSDEGTTDAPTAIPPNVIDDVNDVNSQIEKVVVMTGKIAESPRQEHSQTSAGELHSQLTQIDKAIKRLPLQPTEIKKVAKDASGKVKSAKEKLKAAVPKKPFK